MTDVPPGLVAYLYRTRWDIEKIFDQVKNKLAEKKAWATSDTAKEMQAQFICMAHNLMLLLEDDLRKEGIENEIENKRRRQRLDKALSNTTINKEKLPFFLKRSKNPAQMSVKFIRWSRNNLNTNTSWVQALGALQRVYTVF